MLCGDNPIMTRLLYLFALALTLLTSSCFAESIALTGNEARPPKIHSEEGTPRGILVEILHFIQKETKQDFNLKLYPFSRAYKDALDGKAGIIGLSRSEDRLALFDYGNEPLYIDDVVLVVVKGKEFPFSTHSDLNGKRVGNQRGTRFGPQFELAVKEGRIEIIEAGHPAQLLAMLSKGRVDTVLFSSGKAGLAEALFSSEARELLEKEVEFSVLPTPFSRDPNFMAFAKSMNRTDVLKKVDAALKKGYASGEIPAIINRFSPRPERHTATGKEQ